VTNPTRLQSLKSCHGLTCFPASLRFRQNPLAMVMPASALRYQIFLTALIKEKSYPLHLHPLYSTKFSAEVKERIWRFP
jgi:hypothetical protein